jgi:hypothetical protein
MGALRRACANCGEWLDKLSDSLCEDCITAPLPEYEIRTAARSFVLARNAEYHQAIVEADARRLTSPDYVRYCICGEKMTAWHHCGIADEKAKRDAH